MNPKILIVDSVSVMRANIRTTLESEGFTEFLEAENGEEACVIFSDEKPEVVIMDLSVPGKSGMECLKEMKKFRPDTAVIFCSASAHRELVIESAKLGASDFILKPLKKERLVLAVKRALKIS